MRFARLGLCVALVWLFGRMPVSAQTTSFQHIVVVVQENRTPDNLFYALCAIPELCSTAPSAVQYNIQTRDWLDKSAPGGVITPLTVQLANDYDLNHAHIAFQQQCHLSATKACSMDGGAAVACSGTCPTQPSFRYVDNSTGILDPYLDLVKQYGWANYMFQTNQGPSFPAHQFIFGGTSAPTAADDAAGIFADSNVDSEVAVAGCIASAGATVALVSTVKLADGYIYPCFQHDTMPDVLPPSVSWRYYASAAGSIWTAPNAIQHICEPSAPSGGECEGQKWKENVDLISADVLKDISNCTLRNLSWVTPSGQNSDHADVNTGGGPDWVASIVNAIGESTCKNADGTRYWDSTAILITWDDWGGWYDHVAPKLLNSYEYGFRVPMIVISPYAKAAYASHVTHDFGSILKFIESTYSLPSLGYADAAADDLSDCFNFSQTPLAFSTVNAPLKADYFLNDRRPRTDPDDD